MLLFLVLHLTVDFLSFKHYPRRVFITQENSAYCRKNIEDLFLISRFTCEFFSCAGNYPLLEKFRLGDRRQVENMGFSQPMRETSHMWTILLSFADIVFINVW